MGRERFSTGYAIMLKSTIIAAATAALFALPAFAGFTASTGTDLYTYTGPGTPLAPAVGGTYTVTDQSLATYTPDTAADPQITGGDLANFVFSLTLGVTSVTPSTGAVQTAGTYSIYYNLNNGGSAEDIRVSSGTASLYLTPAFAGFNVATGELAQTLGPANPAFSDLSYGNNANLVLQGGVVDAAGNIALTLRQNAVVVPEPISIGAIAGAGLLLGRRRRA